MGKKGKPPHTPCFRTRSGGIGFPARSNSPDMGTHISSQKGPAHKEPQKAPTHPHGILIFNWGPSGVNINFDGDSGPPRSFEPGHTEPCEEIRSIRVSTPILLSPFQLLNPWPLSSKHWRLRARGPTPGRNRTKFRFVNLKTQNWLVATTKPRFIVCQPQTQT